jgi:hypothetical protein
LFPISKFIASSTHYGPGELPYNPDSISSRLFFFFRVHSLLVLGCFFFRVHSVLFRSLRFELNEYKYNNNKMLSINHQNTRFNQFITSLWSRGRWGRWTTTKSTFILLIKMFFFLLPLLYGSSVAHADLSTSTTKLIRRVINQFGRFRCCCCVLLGRHPVYLARLSNWGCFFFFQFSS